MTWRVALRAVAIGLALAGLAYVIAVASLQRQLLFPRPTLKGVPPRPRDARQLWLSAAGAPVEAWYLPPTTSASARAPLVEIDPVRIVAYGRSLGGAAAAILATQRPMAALVLESTFTSVRSFAHDFWVPELIVRDPFDTLALLRSYSQPLRDRVVPLEHGERLAGVVQGSRFTMLDCGHNDCARPWQTIRQFLSDADVIEP